MKSLSKISAVALIAMACMAFAPMAQAQDVNTGSNTLDGSATNSNSNANVSGVNASNTVGNDASAQSGGNVFDFSNNSTPQGYAPALPSFAGGCRRRCRALVSAADGRLMTCPVSAATGCRR